MTRRTLFCPALALVALVFAAAPARAVDIRPVNPSPPDTIRFTPEATDVDSATSERPVGFDIHVAGTDDEWLRAPIGDELLQHPDRWRSRHLRGGNSLALTLDYNRVDLLRAGLWWQAQRPETMLPRLGLRWEYATGRDRPLYAVQFEQPLLPTARFVLGLDASRRTDHGVMQQVDNIENSIMLLVAHQDWRDYFEREGVGAYLSWRVPDFSTVSVQMHDDEYRSLKAAGHVASWFRREKPLRDNPAIDDGRVRSAIVRLERLAHNTHRSRGGLYHWIEVERAGNGLGGDFDYTRAFADVRSIVRLTPSGTLALRMVGGTRLDGEVPLQRQFVIGGVDGLRGHEFGAFHGDRMAMGQAEYSIDLRAFDVRPRRGGLRALLFIDSGTAWKGTQRDDLVAQHFAADGGIGLATTDDDTRVTVARDLHDPDADFVVSLRLSRPF
jgi:hypothetical protein